MPNELLTVTLQCFGALLSLFDLAHHEPAEPLGRSAGCKAESGYERNKCFEPDFILWGPG